MADTDGPVHNTDGETSADVDATDGGNDTLSDLSTDNSVKGSKLRVVIITTLLLRLCVVSRFIEHAIAYLLNMLLHV